MDKIKEYFINKLKGKNYPFDFSFTLEFWEALKENDNEFSDFKIRFLKYKTSGSNNLFTIPKYDNFYNKINLVTLTKLILKHKFKKLYKHKNIVNNICDYLSNKSRTILKEEANKKIIETKTIAAVINPFNDFSLTHNPFDFLNPPAHSKAT